MFSSSKPIAWLIALGKESLNSLVFIKLGINITVMRPATTTERTQLNLGKKQLISRSVFPHVTRTQNAQNIWQSVGDEMAGRRAAADIRQFKHSEIFQSGDNHTYKGYSANLSLGVA